MKKLSPFCLVVMAVATLLWLENPAPARAQRFDLGLRAVITTADGEPANDIPGYGAFGHYRLNDRWSLGFSVDLTEYDFEQPALLVGLVQDPSLEPIDVLAEATVVSVWIQRNYRRDGARMTWFWGAGLGLAAVDVPDAAGPLASGGRFDIQTEVDTETIVTLSAGFERSLGERWFFEFALRADQHFADWQLADRVSGATGTVDDYLGLGGHFGIGLRF